VTCRKNGIAKNGVDENDAGKICKIGNANETKNTPMNRAHFLVARSFDVIFFLFHDGAELVFLALVVFVAILGLVAVVAAFLPEIDADWVGEEIWIDPRQNFGVLDAFRIVAVLFIEAFFECVIHGVDCNFALLVALHFVDILFLNEE